MERTDTTTRPTEGGTEQLRGRLDELLDALVTDERLVAFDEDERYDWDLFRALGRGGFLRLESDGSEIGPTHVSEAAVLETLGARATSMAVSLVVQYMGIDLLHRFGDDAQRDAYLEPIIAGDASCSFALSEPAGGTDVARGMVTRADRQDDGSYVLNGAKKWIGGAGTADVLLVLARTAPIGRTAIDGVTIFAVPGDAPGLTATPIDTMGIRALAQYDVRFEDVRVPASAIVGELDRGFRHVLGTLNGERLNGAAVALGIAQGALDTAVAWAKERHAFERPVGAFQAIQHQLVDASVAVESARALLDRAAVLADTADPAADAACAMAKLAASRAATTATDVGMRVMGGWGFLRQLPMQRYFRDARLYTFAPTTDEMNRNFIGERHLGLPRSY